MKYVKNTIVDTLMSFIAPYPCLGCGFLGSPLCNDCKYNIVKAPRLHDAAMIVDHSPFIDEIEVVGYRLGVLKTIVRAYKFEYVKGLAIELAALLRPVLVNEVNYVLVPVPTSRKHIRQRGYDHIQLIAKQLGLPCLYLKRLHEHSQVGASKQERKTRAATAFALSEPIDSSKCYIILDDVITTGETVKNVARVLRGAGAKYIKVVAIAYQPLD